MSGRVKILVAAAQHTTAEVYGFRPMEHDSLHRLEFLCLANPGVSMNALTCPQCGSPNVNSVARSSRDADVDYYRCHDCGRVWIEPMAVPVKPNLKAN